MSVLSQIVSRIPGLDDYNEQVRQNTGITNNNVQQAMTLSRFLAEQQQKQVALQRENQFRTEIAGAKTPEEQLSVAMRYGGPDAVARTAAGHLDRQAQIGATKEATLARLSQQAQQFDQNYQIRLRQVGSAEERANLEAQYKQAKLALDQAAVRMTGQRLFYDTGASVDVPQVSINPPGAPPVMRGQVPDEASAVAAINAGGGKPMSLEVPTVAQPAPQSPVAASSPIPAPAQAPAPQDNLDARDLRLRGAPVVTPQPGQGVPGVRSEAPQMPNFTGSPKEVARARNEWMMDQARAARTAASKDGKIGVNLAGGRESVFINRVVNSGNQAAADLENVVKLPISAGRGFFGGRSQGKSLFEAGKETLTTQMTTQEVQLYNVFATGFQRALAAIEGAGLAPTNALMHQMDAVIFKEGDTNFTKLGKLAQTRQIVEKGLEVVAANSRVDPETKKLVDNIITKVRTAVPFTVSELIDLQKLQAVDPNATLSDVMAAHKKPSGAEWNDEKEKRYQELLRKQRGGS